MRDLFSRLSPIAMQTLRGPTPIGAFWPAVMLLDHLGEPAAADIHPG